MLSIEQKEWLTRQAEKYEQHLDLAAGQLQARGLLDIARTYSLGVVVDPEPAHAMYEGRLAIPYHTPLGVVDIRFRCLEDHDCKERDQELRDAGNSFGHKKYMQVGEDHVYNVGALHEPHPAVGITEGELDAEVADTFVLPSVGISGARKWKPFWRRLFEDYERVFVIGDGDKDGRDFAKTVSKKLDNGVPIVMPDGLDVNETYLELGEEELGRLILGEAIS